VAAVLVVALSARGEPKSVEQEIGEQVWGRRDA
jgi:hypothetical protein